MLLALADRVVAYNRAQGGGGNGRETSELVTVIIVTILVIAFLLVIGRLLWDGVLTRLISVARPCNCVWDILGLYILTSLLLAK